VLRIALPIRCVQLAFGETGPVCPILAKAMLAKGKRKWPARNQDVEYVFERFDVEIGVLTSSSVIALEARQDD
jgi:hypothetical protein